MKSPSTFKTSAFDGNQVLKTSSKRRNISIHHNSTQPDALNESKIFRTILKRVNGLTVDMCKFNLILLYRIIMKTQTLAISLSKLSISKRQ